MLCQVVSHLPSSMEKSVLPLNLMAQDKDILKIRFGFLHPPFFSYFHFLIYLVRACMLSHFSCVRFLATLWTIVLQAPLSMEFSRQEYWSGLPCPLPGDLLDTVIDPWSPALHVDLLPSESPGKPEEFLKEHNKTDK